ncbi:MAG: Ig-like domain-containing protein [Spirochaetales bacterium]|nr:Ig-like domain-containing protein [Spirochaetales bacterium]
MSNKILVLLLILAVSACGLIDLSVLNVTSFPEYPDDILKPGEQISLLFSEPVDRLGTEALFHLTGPEGDCDGFFSWDDCRMVFTPDKKMQPGFRYCLKSDGDIKTPDRRSFYINILLPFYYETDALPPLLVDRSPADAEITGTQQPIELCFSKPILKNIFEQEFTISPQTALEYLWNSDSTGLRISPKKQWLNLQFYKWTIPTDITDHEGIPMPEVYSGSFLVQLDTSAPSVIGVHPARDNEDGTFSILTDLNPDELTLGEHLSLSFSEAVDFASLRQSFGIDPSIDGYLLSLTPDTALYYIDESLPPETEYRLSLQRGLKDLSGNAAPDDWEMIFTPDIPTQRILTVEIEDENGLFLSLDDTYFGNDGYIDTPGLNYYDTQTLHFIISLSRPYPDTATSEKAAFLSLISLTPVFPPGTLSPTLFSSTWEGPDSLRLIYNGLISFLPDEPVYYKFKISPGGRDSAAPGGSYLTDGIEFTFKAEAQ